MLITDAFANFMDIYYLLSTLFFFSPIIIYYFKSKAFQIELRKFHFLIVFAYSLLGEIIFLGIEFISSEPDRGIPILQTGSEFIIVNLFFLFFYYMFQSYSWNIIYAHEIIIPTETKHENLVPILKKTNELMGANLYRSNDQTDAEYFVPGSFYTRFDQFIQELEKPKGFKVILINSSRNLRFLSIFQTLLIMPLILARASPNAMIVQANESASQFLTLTVHFSATPTYIDVLWWFLIVGLLFLFYALTLASASENVLLKFEETFKKAKIDQVLNIPSFNFNKPDLSLSGTKDKLSDKKDSVTSQLEDQKRRRVDEVMGILNPNSKKEEVKQMDPDVLRLEALIFTVRTVLQATPAHRKITLDELTEYFNKKTKTTPEELESIVFGLIQRKEVEGNYNIWDKIYSGGTPARRFVDKTLEFAENMQGEINSIKVKADGSVEFYFKPEEEQEEISSEAKSKEKNPNNEETDEPEEIDKFDSF